MSQCMGCHLPYHDIDYENVHWGSFPVSMYELSFTLS